MFEKVKKPAPKPPSKLNTSSNPFEDVEEEKETNLFAGDSANPFSESVDTTNPFKDDEDSTNPFNDGDDDEGNPFNENCTTSPITSSKSPTKSPEKKRVGLFKKKKAPAPPKPTRGTRERTPPRIVEESPDQDR